MRKAIFAGASAMLLAAIASFAAGGAKMKITSSAFQQGGNIPSKFSCDGPNTNPPFQMSDVPPEAKSLVLIVDDPDAPSGLFTHWAVWNISPQTNTIAEGTTLKGGQGTNDFGRSGYGGPCPPSGTHRYYFKIFRAGSGAGFTFRREAEPTGRGHERSCDCTRRIDGSLFAKKINCSHGAMRRRAR